MISKILKYFDYLYPNPHCELKYNKDYEFLISVMLSAQTTDKKVNQVTSKLFKKYPTIELLNKASILDLETIIKEIGTYHKKALNILSITSSLIKDYQGKVPNNREYLESLNGVGRKTVSVVLGELFNEPNLAVDTHVARVSRRLGLTNSQDVLVIENDLKKIIPSECWIKCHHQMVLFGRYKCRSIKPLCDDCQLKEICKKELS